MPNPYTLRPVTEARWFVAARGGRGAQAHRLLQNLSRLDPPPDCVSLLGERRYGKTSLLGFLQRGVAETPQLRTACVNLLALNPPTPAGFFATLSRALARAGVLPAQAEPLNCTDLEELLYRFHRGGERLVLFIDEFDLVARDRRFTPEFFDQLRALANDLPLTLVLASVAPLTEIAHSGVCTSPFFNIFLRERLVPLSRAEAEWLIASAPGAEAGLSDCRDAIFDLAGGHPYFLQLACLCAWELHAMGEVADAGSLREVFARRGRDQFQAIWDHSSPEERKAFCALVHGVRATVTGLDTLQERGYVTARSIASSALADFLQDQCAEHAPCSPQPAARPATPSNLLPPMQASQVAPELRLGLVVGVDQYRHERAGRLGLPPLRFAEKDAQAVAHFLASLGFAVKCLCGAQASHAALMEAFDWLRATTSAVPHPNSCFAFHFSGHGHLDPGNDEVAYLMLHDSDPHTPAASAIEMTRLVYELLPQVRVPNALVLLDACHAGFGAGVKDVVPTSHLNNVAQQLFSGLRGRMVLAACAGEAHAREEASLGHGIFTNYVLRHWRDLDGSHPPNRITFGSLIDYVGDAIPLNHPQVPLPVYNGVGVGGTFVLRQW